MRNSIESRFRTSIFIGLVGLCLTQTLPAGEFNPVLSIGDSAPTWKELPATDGKSYAFENFKDADVMVVVFTCNSCPYSVDYEDRIIKLAKHYQTSKESILVVLHFYCFVYRPQM